MTAIALREILAVALSSLLGTYTIPGGATTKAIYVGEPPNTWIASGVECRIEPIPELEQVTAYWTGAIRETWHVRIVARDNASVTKHLAAVRSILSRWSTAQARAIAANEELAIPAQHTITIPL